MTQHTTSDELRDKVYEILYDCACGVDYDESTDLILALIKKHELDARIDEHKRLHEVTSMSINPKSSEITKAGFMLNVNDFQKYRLGELKKQREEIEGE